MVGKTFILDTRNVHKIVLESWTEIKKCINAIDNTYIPEPAGYYEVFDIVLVDRYVTNLKIKPIIFKLPESFSSKKSKLIIAVKGEISFVNISTQKGENCLQTKYFETKVEIYRQERTDTKQKSVLKHSFGALYHFDSDKFDHPKFHVHITDEMDDEIVEKIERVFGKISPVSNLKGIVRKVRIPTAQMDVFSVFVQLCADHMIASDDTSLKTVFVRLQDACNFFQSADNDFDKQVQTPNSSICLRSVHWYEN